MAEHRPPNAPELEHSLALLAARRRDITFEAIAASASELLHSTDLRESLPKVAERLADATGVDRVHIF